MATYDRVLNNVTQKNEEGKSNSCSEHQVHTRLSAMV